MSPAANQNNLSFWEHLDVLRSALLRILAVWLIFSVLAFICKDRLFDVVFAPRSGDFLTYRAINALCSAAGLPGVADVEVNLINTGLARQFLVHMKAAMCAGVLLAAPYALYLLFSFVAPGLYSSERRYARVVVGGGYVMFLLGVLLGYGLIFPLTFRFLGTYQVASDVVNMIDLESYMSTLILICLFMGAMFELPVVAWICAGLGLISAPVMARYRRHAVVVILTVAAIITPTSDVLTLLVVSLPVCALYEASILLVRHTNPSPALSA